MDAENHQAFCNHYHSLRVTSKILLIASHKHTLHYLDSIHLYLHWVGLNVDIEKCQAGAIAQLVKYLLCKHEHLHLLSRTK